MKEDAVVDQDQLARDILSDVIVHMKYAKYLPDKKRRETWEELVTRNKNMHLKKYPQLRQEIHDAYKFVYDKKVMPSMRTLQFAGEPIEVNPVRLFNCSFRLVDGPSAFWEIMFMLLSGTGCGFSVQKQHVAKLPTIKATKKDRRKRYLIPDSIEGWAEAVRVLVESYFEGKSEVDFDFRGIRPKGADIITSGGKAPGPEPLRECLTQITSVFENALQERGSDTNLKPIEVHDIICFIGASVMSGGIRRSATISIFSADDHEMLECKSGPWWELNPQRQMANNTVVLERDKITKEDFLKIWERVEASGAGEPGVMFTSNTDWGLNPCAEISLKGGNGGQFCNLVTMNASNIQDEQDFINRCRAASLIATLQAGYTDFHYLGKGWKETTEEEALIGVSITGIASGKLDTVGLRHGADIVKEVNAEIADKIGIEHAARVSTVKPEGTSSLVCSSSSGIHAWHNDYYIRRVRVNKNEAIYEYLKTACPDIIEDEFFKPESTAVISVPQRAPEGATIRTETALDTLERVRRYNKEWVQPGHRSGDNYNNVSCTISVKDDEWIGVGDWMWDNRNDFTAISVLPYNGGTYKQAPFEDITKEEYENLIGNLTSIDLTQVIEEKDNTDLKGEVACGGGQCEIT